MNNMNQRPGNCSQERNANVAMNMNDRRYRGNMTGNTFVKRSSMPMASNTSCNCSCNCNPCNCVDNADSIQNDALRGMPLGMGYVPWQHWECVYNVDEGLSKGTIFPSLDLPFYGCIPRGYRCNKGGR